MFSKTPHSPPEVQHGLILNFPGGKLRFRAHKLHLLALTLSFPPRPWKRTQKVLTSNRSESLGPTLAPISLQKKCRNVPEHTETCSQISAFPQLTEYWMHSVVLMMNYISVTLGKLQKGCCYYLSAELRWRCEFSIRIGFACLLHYLCRADCLAITFKVQSQCHLYLLGKEAKVF